jgi:hypothetical protein
MPRTSADRQLRSAATVVQAARAALESQGWRRATVDGRECRLDEAPEDGHFMLRETSADHEATIELICLTSEYVLDLHNMVELLKDRGYAEVDLGVCDAVGIRPATKAELDERARTQALRVAPLLAALLPRRHRPARDALF